MNGNIITHKYGKSQTPYAEIYQWSIELTAEQEANPDYYLWTDEDKKLLFKLMNTRGNLIAVIGLQGSGKTALREALSNELAKKGIKPLSLKWLNGHAQLEEESNRSLMGDLEFVIMFVDELIKSQGKEKAFKILVKEFGRDAAEDFFRIHKYEEETYKKEASEYYKQKLAKFIPRLLTLTKYFGKRKEVFEKEIFLSFLHSASCILIDTPDYDKRNRREMVKDLNALQSLWEELSEYSIEIGDYPPNIVIFFQKELFQGHFFRQDDRPREKAS
ncbi:hypothetical protein DRN63_04235 [Nanoarchaeota archaeon]|nr:MAG: hypothetical protein DRN63_04235 [Nanoarchaeota archaeon]